MREAIATQALDLRDLTVFTEIGTGGYLTTPFIAAMAGARQTFAITRDSAYGSAASVAAAARELARLSGTEGRVQVVAAKTPDTLASADIVTNLGFVRPLDRNTVADMKPGAVIPLMCEEWEFRGGDVDLDACSERGIAVVATNEDYPGVGVFDFSGPLCMKLLFEAGIEVYMSRVAIVSGDKFGVVIDECLRLNGAEVRTIATLRDDAAESCVAHADAVIVADYCNLELFIGPGGQMEAARLAHLAPGVAVIPFAGRVDRDSLQRAGIWCLPESGSEPYRMARTFAHLGVRPVIDLHCAGLKVAEIVARLGPERRSDRAMRTALGARGCLVSREVRADV